MMCRGNRYELDIEILLLTLETSTIIGEYINIHACLGRHKPKTVCILNTMKIFTILTSALASLVVAQTPAPYTDTKSGITFNTLQHGSGLFFGLALPLNSSSTDFIATIGGQGTGWSGVSLGGGMLNKLLIVAWPNAQTAVSSFRKVSYVPCQIRITY
jgi:hypothetical protein